MGEVGGLRFFMDGALVFIRFSGLKKTFEEVFYIFDVPGASEVNLYLSEN